MIKIILSPISVITLLVKNRKGVNLPLFLLLSNSVLIATTNATLKERDHNKRLSSPKKSLANHCVTVLALT